MDYDLSDGMENKSNQYNTLGGGCSSCQEKSPHPNRQPNTKEALDTLTDTTGNVELFIDNLQDLSNTDITDTSGDINPHFLKGAELNLIPITTDRNGEIGYIYVDEAPLPTSTCQMMMRLAQPL